MSKDGKCPHCGQDNCYAHCYERSDGQHRMAFGSPHQSRDTPRGVVDITCEHCGQSGAAELGEMHWE